MSCCGIHNHVATATSRADATVVSESLDLNLIENLLSVLKVKVEKRALRTKQTPKQLVEEEWNEISFETIAN